MGWLLLWDMTEHLLLRRAFPNVICWVCLVVVLSACLLYFTLFCFV